MKRWLLFGLLGFYFMAANAQTAVQPVNISVKSGKVKLNKVTFTAGWRAKPVLAALAAVKDNDRLRPGFNITHTYDELGLVLFESRRDEKATDTLSEIQLYISQPKDSNSVMPKGLFKGVLQIEKLVINSNLNIDDIKNGLEGYKETDSYMENNHRLAKSGIYIYFQYNTTNDRLIKVSIGKDKRGS